MKTQQANQEKVNQQALAAMAHDIKAPLAAIVNILSVVEKGYIEDIGKTRELVGKACKKAETLITMLDDIMDYTLLANRTSILREDVNLCEVMEDSISTLAPYASTRNITIDNRIKIHDALVSGNYTFLLRVFNNIIMNAIKYNKEKGKITITCTKKKANPDKTGDNIVTTINDTGIGISREDLVEVFNIFRRGKNARRNIDGSIGLGLSLVKQIIEEHNGTIDIASTLGVGTTIIVTLPLLRGNEGGTNELQNFGS